MLAEVAVTRPPEGEPTPTDVALFRLRKAVNERHAEKLYFAEAVVALRALEMHPKLVAERDALKDEFLANQTARRWLEDQCLKAEAERDRYREALEKIKKGVDHPGGVQEAPDFYEAICWASAVANAVLREKPE